MSARYLVRLYDTTGTIVAVFDDWTGLSYTKNLDGYGDHTFSFNALDPRVSLFLEDCFVEVIRRDDDLNIAPYQDYIGFHRTPQIEITELDKELFTSYGRSFEDLIRRRVVAWEVGTPQADKTALFADDAMKQYVDENCGLGAVPPRVVTGTITNFATAAPTSAAPVWTGSMAWRNVYDVCREIALAQGVDFAVTYDGVAGAPVFTFRTYYPMLGTDRSVGPLMVTFATNMGNMAKPLYIHHQDNEVTRMIVLGQNQGGDRVTYVQTSADAGNTPWNVIEHTHDARQEDATAGLANVATSELQHLQSQEEYTFDVLQTSTTAYGRDYFLGDKVVARMELKNGYTVQRTKRIIGVTVTVSDHKEAISINTSDLVL